MTRRRANPSSIALLCLLLLQGLFAASAGAHEFKLDAVVSTFVKVDGDEVHLLVRAPLYLFKSVRFPVSNAEVDIPRSAEAMARALAGIEQDIQLLDDGHALKVRQAVGRLALPSDRSFESYEQARSHIASPLEPDTHIFVDQGYVDAEMVYPAGSPNAAYALRTAIAPELGGYLKLTIRYQSAQGASRAFVVKGGAGTVDLNPTALSAAAGFVGLGIAHIVTGYDHLLFLVCLVIPLRGIRQLLTVVTGFTLAHSLTLIGSAFGITPQGAWFPPFVEMVIALSIVYMAIETILGCELRRRIMLTLLFGLMHGFGFSYALKEQLQFAGTHLLVSLFAFNAGIEIGQIAVLCIVLPGLALVTRFLLPGRVGAIVLAAILAHVGWHWMTDRWDALVAVPWPSPSPANLSQLALWLAGLVLAGGLAQLAIRRLRLAPVPGADGPAPRRAARAAGD